MAESLDRPSVVTPTLSISPSLAKLLPVAVLAFIAAGLALYLGFSFYNLTPDNEALVESTPYELAVWVADQSKEEAPISLLAVLAKSWAQARSLVAMPEADAIAKAQVGTLLWAIGAALFSLIGGVGILTQARWARNIIAVAIVCFMGLLFMFPVVEGNSAPAWVLVGMGLLVTANGLVGGKTSASMGVILAFAVIFMVWESSKALAATFDLQVRVPQAAWTVTPYATLDEALVGLQNGEVKAVFADAKDLEALMPTYPQSEVGGTAYPTLRVVQPYFGEQQFIFPLTPDIAGRLSIAVAERDVSLNRPSQWVSQAVGAVEGGFALDKYLNQPRNLVLLDLKILNNLNLPHLQSIAEAFLQPARRNGEQLLIRILGVAGLYTWGEAVFGFTFGALLGLILGTMFAHSKLLERAFLPYVVASQTIPILAIAPMIVIWLGASPTSVAVIAVYITFFPVTINTLRGLTSPDPLRVELMESYAASRWTTLWKLRFPSALPYIFAALKISATASVVGAIIGELPSGIGDGLGRAILDFSSDYSAISTPKLWAAIVTASLVGVTFFLIVSAIEKVVLRRYVRSSER